jgi:hypothetical protein
VTKEEEVRGGREKQDLTLPIGAACEPHEPEEGQK